MRQTYVLLKVRAGGVHRLAQEKVGAIVNTPEGKGLVVENNLIARTLKVKLNNTPDDVAPKTFTVKQCKLVKDGYIKVNKKELEELKGLE